MTQLIFNGIYLPKATRDRYWAHEEILGEDIEMISGRLVTEIRGVVYKVHYEFDKLPDEVWRAIRPALKRKEAVTCSFLTDDSDELITAAMKCTEMQDPTFAFEFGGRAMWHNIAFTLREVRPHA